MGIFRFDRSGRSSRSRRSRSRIGCDEIGQSIPPGATLARTHAGQAVHRVDGRLRLLARRAAGHAGGRQRQGFRPRGHSRGARIAISVSAYLFRGYWADVGTVASFYDANIMLTQPGAPFKFYDANRPIYTHPRFLPGSRLSDCAVREAIIAEGCYPRALLDRGVDRRHPHAHPARRRRSAARCCSAPTTTRMTAAAARNGRAAPRHRPRRRAGSRHRRQERAHRRRRPAGQRARRSITPTATATTSATASSSCRRTA